MNISKGCLYKWKECGCQKSEIMSADVVTKQMTNIIQDLMWGREGMAGWWNVVNECVVGSVVAVGGWGKERRGRRNGLEYATPCNARRKGWVMNDVFKKASGDKASGSGAWGCPKVTRTQEGHVLEGLVRGSVRHEIMKCRNECGRKCGGCSEWGRRGIPNKGSDNEMNIQALSTA